jgi:hypothetical protein
MHIVCKWHLTLLISHRTRSLPRQTRSSGWRGYTEHFCNTDLTLWSSEESPRRGGPFTRMHLALVGWSKRAVMILFQSSERYRVLPLVLFPQHQRLRQSTNVTVVNILQAQRIESYCLCSSASGGRLRPAIEARIFSLCSSDSGRRTPPALRPRRPARGSMPSISASPSRPPRQPWQTGHGSNLCSPNAPLFQIPFHHKAPIPDVISRPP